MTVLAFDTATSATVVGVLRDDGELFAARHDPEAGERPGHARQLLGLVEAALAAGGVDLADVRRLGVGVGPGSFTGLRIGVATARALAQGCGAELVGVSTLHALALPAARDESRTVVSAIDARRGEAFAAAWRGERELLAPAALGPERLAEAVAGLPEPVLAVGEGALRFRAHIEPAGAVVTPDRDPAHRVEAASLCQLAAAARAIRSETVTPAYLRLPDAELALRSRKP